MNVLFTDQITYVISPAVEESCYHWIQNDPLIDALFASDTAIMVSHFN